MRVVLDTNVLVSAVLTKQSPTRLILDLHATGTFQIVVSEEILAEYQKVLTYPHIAKRIKKTAEQTKQFLHTFQKLAILVEPTEAVTVVKNDPEDNKFLACALAGKAEYLVSGDSDLLTFKIYKGIHIITPTRFLLFLHMRRAA